MWRRPACQTLLKALDISSTTAWVAPDLLKALAILSDTTVRRSVVDWEDLKPHWKSEKRPHLIHFKKIFVKGLDHSMTQKRVQAQFFYTFPCYPKTCKKFLGINSSQEWRFEELQHYLDILVKIFHSEPLESVYYWEKKK